MTPMEWFAPKSRKEAISMLKEYGERARIIAGGTDLLVQIKKRVSLPDIIISMERIQDLDFINHDEKIC